MKFFQLTLKWTGGAVAAAVAMTTTATATKWDSRSKHRIEQSRCEIAANLFWYAWRWSDIEDESNEIGMERKRCTYEKWEKTTHFSRVSNILWLSYLNWTPCSFANNCSYSWHFYTIFGQMSRFLVHALALKHNFFGTQTNSISFLYLFCHRKQAKIQNEFQMKLNQMKWHNLNKHNYVLNINRMYSYRLQLFHDHKINPAQCDYYCWILSWLFPTIAAGRANCSGDDVMSCVCAKRTSDTIPVGFSRIFSRWWTFNALHSHRLKIWQMITTR